MRRRDFMTGTLAGAAALSGGPVLAAVDLGGATLTSVSDGNLVLPDSFVFPEPRTDELTALRQTLGVDGAQLRPECNLALYRDGQNTVLFDAGAGPDFMPSAGKITDSLDALGLAPDEISHVVFTHAHPDHIWGLLDDFNDPLFSEATYLMGRAEWDYWWNPATVDEIGEARAPFAVGAKRRMEAIEDQVALFDDGDEILPGVAALFTPGHTPGHMAFELRRGSQAALIVGDAIGNGHMALARPAWESAADQDPETAIRSRLALLDRLTSEQVTVLGFHLPDGGLGRIEADGEGYRFIAEDA